VLVGSVLRRFPCSAGHPAGSLPSLCLEGFSGAGTPACEPLRGRRFYGRRLPSHRVRDERPLRSPQVVHPKLQRSLLFGFVRHGFSRDTSAVGAKQFSPARKGLGIQDGATRHRLRCLTRASTLFPMRVIGHFFRDASYQGQTATSLPAILRSGHVTEYDCTVLVSR
jgi:hypothetical protein